tara:strand:+ start:625 stop:732 length:108 start_codon:yes stop_codon:yes gene_type:complete
MEEHRCLREYDEWVGRGFKGKQTRWLVLGDLNKEK